MQGLIRPAAAGGLHHAMAVPVRKRSHAGKLVEHRAKITLVAESHLLGDLRDWAIRLYQRLLCPFNPVGIEIASEGSARKLAEVRCELGFAQAAHARGVGRVKHVAHVSGKKLQEVMQAFKSTLLVPERVQ